MKRKELFGNLILFIGSIIWGVAFMFQSRASSYIEPFTLNAIRCFIGGIVLIPAIIIKRKIEKKPVLEDNKEAKKKLIIASLICGTCLCIAINLQQFGITIYPDGVATSGRGGFITALYVVLVPILSIFLKKKLKISAIIGVILATIGAYLLCIDVKSNKLYLGDLIIFFCAVAFAIQILCIDKYANDVDPLKLNCFQFILCGLISTILMFIFESPSMEAIKICYIDILYIGIFSSGVAYTFQIIGEKYSNNPTTASIIMSLESVFALLSGVLFLHEVLSLKEIIGCIIMFIAIIVSQLNFTIKKKEISE